VDEGEEGGGQERNKGEKGRKRNQEIVRGEKARGGQEKE
jgi:hypothetical protein